MLLVAVALLPVSMFLLLLLVFDSFKLVPTSTLVRAIVAGAGAALAAWALHGWLFRVTGLDVVPFSRYVAPLTEETLKAAFVLYAIQRRQIGFIVDAAIIGFAIGAGFAVVENIEYLMDLADQRVWLWVVRGFGTAMLHASTTAIVAVGTKSIRDRYPDWGVWPIAGPWFIAVVLHSLFNHAQVSPVLAAGVPMVVLPLVVVVVFNRSEKMTGEWVGNGTRVSEKEHRAHRTPRAATAPRVERTRRVARVPAGQRFRGPALNRQGLIAGSHAGQASRRTLGFRGKQPLDRAPARARAARQRGDRCGIPKATPLAPCVRPERGVAAIIPAFQ